MLKVEQRSQIWQTMIEPSRHRVPLWKEGMEPFFEDPRNNPINYMLMCGDFDTTFRPELDTANLKRTSEGRFVLHEQEDTGILGLMRSVQLITNDIARPNSILLVGSMNHTGVTELMSWLKFRNWCDVDITLVDKERLPLHTIKQLIDAGEIQWDGAIDLVKSDIRKYLPGRKYDWVIGDILNPYMDSYLGYPAYYQESPYVSYEKYLEHIRTLSNGWFLSRCFLLDAPSKRISRKPQPMEIPDEEKLARAWENLGEMRLVLDKQATLTTEGIYAGFSPQSFCGLEVCHPIYRHKNIISGVEAINVYRRLYQRYFPDKHQSVEIRDSSGKTFLTFVCDLR